jgi:hypothetical protein
MDGQRGRLEATPRECQETEMKPSRIAVFALGITAAGAAGAIAQSNSPAAPMGPMGAMPMQHHMPGMMAHGQDHQAVAPTEPGQAAFGAIQEVVTMLQADPHTDWSKVDIDALRQHLIDMDEVTMRAVAAKEPIENGLRIKVTGSDRTLAAIQRMVPDHAREIDGLNGWIVRASALPDGVELTVTAGNPAEVQKIRALGFMGIMVQGSHHQMHHLAMAKGEPLHTH